MNLKDNKIIYILLILIIIFSVILIIKINNQVDYDEELQKKIYAQYNDVIISNEDDKTNNDYIEEIKNNIRYIKEYSLKYEKDKVIGEISIPKINIEYPIINNYTEEGLKIAPAKYKGVNPNRIGNCVIVGHNYRNDKMFSKISKLENGDIIEITDLYKNTIQYEVYDKYEIDEYDFSCISQDTNQKKVVTLITCLNFNNSKRLVVRCIEKT